MSIGEKNNQICENLLILIPLSCILTLEKKRKNITEKELLIMNKGFSLVELIVVIAIMAILVGVAVPVYTSYIDKASTGVEAQYVDELERAINTVCIDMKANMTTVTGSTEESDFVPVKVVIKGTTVTAYEATSSAGVTACDFITLLTNVIDLDTSSKEYTFTLDDDGTVTNVNPDPRA